MSSVQKLVLILIIWQENIKPSAGLFWAQGPVQLPSVLAHEAGPIEDLVTDTLWDTKDN